MYQVVVDECQDESNQSTGSDLGARMRENVLPDRAWSR